MCRASEALFITIYRLVNGGIDNHNPPTVFRVTPHIIRLTEKTPLYLLTGGSSVGCFSWRVNGQRFSVLHYIHLIPETWPVQKKQ